MNESPDTDPTVAAQTPGDAAEPSGEETAPPADVGEAHIDLMEGFDPASLESWEVSAAKVVNKPRPEDRQLEVQEAVDTLRTRTLDDYAIEPLYTAATAPGLPAAAPGEFPFTRGGALRPAELPWDVRQVFDDPDAARTAEQVAADLEHGVSSVHLVVGSAGIDAGDLATALAPVLTDLAPISLSCPTSRRESLAGAKALAEFLDGKPVLTQAPQAAQQGSFGLDPVGHAAIEGHEGPVTLDEATLAIVCTALDLAEGRELAPMRAITIDTLAWHEAGASNVQELAAAVATGIATVRLLVEAGIAARDAFRLVEFRVSATQQQFQTIARLRALRTLWAHVAEHVAASEAGAGGSDWHADPTVAAARQHAVMGRRIITRDDPSVNILRGTIACFAAAAGGAEAITVLPFDTAAGLPDGHSRRVARNTQTLLAAESHVGAVTDPAGGAWFVESLTAHYVDLAWKYVQGLESGGGLATAEMRALLCKNVVAVDQMRLDRLASRTQGITGVSMFPLAGEVPLERRGRADRAAPTGTDAVTAEQVDAELALPRSWDSLPFEMLRDRSAAASLDGERPRAALVCVGARKDFGPRETFAANVLLVAGIEPVTVEVASADEVGGALREACGEAPAVAVVAAAPGTNAEQGAAVAEALREAGVQHVVVAGKAAEIEAADSAIATGDDVIGFLTDLLDAMGVAR
ncbi:methylmalonyl-CoA mutase family protein [Kytococcus sedentarius]|uniref:methylmalonyl-CoA mutase family protein n=1 Tax=Kytococcus sedentarius TaxID=1276 RepID=UPI0035BBBD1C